MATRNSTNTAMTVSAAGAVQRPLQPAFFAYYSASVANQTGDGTVVTLKPDAITLNVSSGYDAGTGAFTAPITGIYSFDWCVACNTITANFTSFITKAIATSRTFTLMTYNPSAAVPASQGQSGRFYCNMTAGDTIYLTVQVSGFTKTIGVTGGAVRTRFSGKLEC